MKFELDDYHRNVSEEDLIADLKRVAEIVPFVVEKKVVAPLPRL
jgi:hypothetical protein